MMKHLGWTFRQTLVAYVCLFSLIITPLICHAQESIKDYRSKNFVIHTDMPEAEVEELLERLETMLGLVARYWGRPSRGSIEMFVVNNRENWNSNLMPPDAWQSVSSGGGLTITQKRTIGSAWQAKAMVYAVSRQGTPQHEAIHAYCGQTFGHTGPVWYSEGMAEVGKYWKGPKDRAVRCYPEVIRYLKKSPIKPLKELVSEAQYTGDSWQNYAWRWTLCHLLGFNDNYSDRFKPLGQALMSEQPRVDFWTVYGSKAREIEFEHQLFISNLESGYRVDLCSWDWKTRATPIRGKRVHSTKIDAARGWQASRLKAEPDTSYSIETKGTWNISAEAECDASGTDSGQGQLVGIIFDDYSLSEEFEIGAEGTFTVPQSGILYVRCKDNWGELDDNEGTIQVRIGLAETRAK